MGDSTCLVRGFGYPSVIPIPNESKQGNLMLALGDSVSFGRFLNESLSWEKRSTFLRKNYVEEAEHYSRPGSVAQKKAFFEAHYKRIATKKAANADALEEESAVGTIPGEVRDNGTNEGQLVALDSGLDICDAHEQSSLAVGKTVVDEESSIATPGKMVLEGRSLGKNQRNVVIPENEASEEKTVEKSRGNEAFKKSRSVEKSPMKLHNFENQVAVEKPVKLSKLGSQEDSVSSADILSGIGKNSSNLSSSEALTHRKTFNDPSTPAKQVSPLEKENNAILSTIAASVDLKSSPSKSFNALMRTSVKGPVEELISPTMEKENLRHAQSSTMVLAPIEKQPNVPSTLKKTPVKEPHRELISATMKTENLGLACSSTVSTAPLKTPVVAQSKIDSTNPATASSLSERIRTNTPSVSSGLGSKSTSHKWHFISSLFSKSCASQSSAESSLSTLSSEKSASKSRQKPKENLNANESRKTQTRKSLKEKAGNKVLGKLGCIFCIKDPRLVNEVATPENQGSISVLPPPQSPSNLNKNSLKKNSPKIAKLLTKSFAEKIASENAPPNIQQ